MPGELDGVQGVSGKSGNFFCDNQIELIPGRVVDHAVEVLPLFRGGSRQALVNVARHEDPVGVFPDEILVIGDLVAQGVQLLVAFRGHPGVEGHPQGEVVNRAGFQLLAEVVNVHGILSFRFIIITMSI